MDTESNDRPGESRSPEWLPSHEGEDATPPSQPEGSLVPPPKEPPTAVGAAAESPPPGRQPRSSAWRARAEQRGVGNMFSAMLDLADDLGDRIASVLGLRRTHS